VWIKGIYSCYFFSQRKGWEFLNGQLKTRKHVATIKQRELDKRRRKHKSAGESGLMNNIYNPVTTQV